MDRIQQAAERSVARATAFACLAIAVLAAGLSAEPGLALRTAAAAALLLWAGLRLSALRAPSRPYRRTEVWMMLEPRPLMPPEVLQRLIGEAIRQACDRYAGFALTGAFLLWLAGVVLGALAA
ncbi:hypothetical protein SH611_20585 [Geminicoccaceae bacterium 1502E]|nr:hypothetical protein [Geminicoccaceae bacterium 1502E]